MNRDKYISDSLTDIVTHKLPVFNQIAIFDGANWDKQSKFPYVYIYNPADSTNNIDIYENGSFDDYDVTIDIIIYVGFKSSNDVLKQGFSQVEYWERAADIERVFRRETIDTYQDESEYVAFLPIRYMGKEMVNPNNGKGVGLGMIHLQIMGKVTLL